MPDLHLSFPGQSRSKQRPIVRVSLVKVSSNECLWSKLIVTNERVYMTSYPSLVISLAVSALLPSYSPRKPTYPSSIVTLE